MSDSIKIVKEEFTSLNIKSWAEEDRPREKFLLKGASSLSDAELIAILIGSGTRTMSAVDLAKLILSKADNDLNKIARWSIKDLMKFKGMGEAKAITIAAALELARRKKYEQKELEPTLKTSKDFYHYMSPHFLDLPHEEIWILLMNQKMSPIKKILVSKGGIAGTIFDIKIIMKHAIENFAQHLVLFHNHPSGNLEPSSSDRIVTQKMIEACKILDINFSDHIIFTDRGFYSFNDEYAYSKV